MSHFNQEFIQFFIDLAPNNHKDWFDENRKRYIKNVKDPMSRFVEHMIEILAAEDPRMKGVQAKDCIFRINRDIRFSKDKTPYKLNTSAAISPLGRKDHRYPGLYFEVGPGRLAIAGGAYSMDKDALYQLRTHMVNHVSQWQKAAKDKGFLECYPDGLQGDENKRLPPEFNAKGEILPLLFKKQLYFWKEFDSDVILQEDLDQILVDHFKAAAPIRNLLVEAFDV